MKERCPVEMYLPGEPSSLLCDLLSGHKGLHKSGAILWKGENEDVGVSEAEALDGGRKDDSGKDRFDLIPPGPLAQVANLFTIGATKYGERNWEKGFAFGRVFGAMQRHAWAWWNGEELDPTDGQHHLTSVAWGALVLLEFLTTGVGKDDRPHVEREQTRKSVEEARARLAQEFLEGK